MKNSILVIGAGGPIGGAYLDALLRNHALGDVEAATVGPMAVAAPRLRCVGIDDPDHAAPRLAAIICDQRRSSNGREDIFFRPDARRIAPLAKSLHAKGVANLLVILPLLGATDAEALRHGLTTRDQHELAAQAFERVVIVRATDPPSAARTGRWLSRLAHALLAQLRCMAPGTAHRQGPAETARALADFTLRMETLPRGIHLVQLAELMATPDAATGLATR